MTWAKWIIKTDRRHVFYYRLFRVQAGSWRVEKYSKPRIQL